MVDKRFYQHLGSLSLSELLGGIDVDIPEGQFCDLIIEHAAPVALAGVSDIAFVEGTSGIRALANSKAGVCLVKADKAELVGAQGILPLITDHPRANFAFILDKLYRPLAYGASDPITFDDVEIAQGVVIGNGAKIGAGTNIGPNSVIGPGVVIGSNCQIGANAVIEFSVIGNNCKIYHGAILGGAGFGVASSANGSVDIPHIGTVKLGDNVTIGCLTTIDRAMFSNTSIGDGSKLDNSIQIAHNVKIGRHCLLAAQVGIAGSAVIGDGVTMGGKVGIRDNIKIGDGVTLAALANAIGDVPAGEVWGGTPAVPFRDHMRQLSFIRRMAKAKPKS